MFEMCTGVNTRRWREKWIGKVANTKCENTKTAVALAVMSFLFWLFKSFFNNLSCQPNDR